MKSPFPVERLDAVVSFRGGGTPSKKKSEFWNGNIPWVSPKDMKCREIDSSIDRITEDGVANSSASMIPPGSVLVVVRSGILARTIPTAVTLCELTVNQDIKVLCPTDRIDAYYLEYALQAYEPKLLKLVTRGATVHRLATDVLKSTEVLVPPLPEQKRIVAILDEAFAAIETATANADKNLANVRGLFESQLNNAFQIRHSDWEEAKLADLCAITHGSAFKGKNFAVDEDVSKPIVITPGNFTEDAALSFTQNNTKRYSGEPPEAFTFDIGDLVVVMTDLSSKMKILGKPAFIERPYVLHNQRIGRLVFKDDSLDRRFLYYYFRTSRFLADIKSTATGTMVKHTAPKRILSNVISFPTVRDQAKIVEHLDSFAAKTKSLEDIHLRKRAVLSELRQSILKKAFTGGLTADLHAADRSLSEASV